MYLIRREKGAFTGRRDTAIVNRSGGPFAQGAEGASPRIHRGCAAGEGEIAGHAFPLFRHICRQRGCTFRNVFTSLVEERASIWE